MIIMKKKFSLILVISIILLIITAFVILICTRTNNLKVISINKHYSILYVNEPEIEISLYSNHQNSKYLKTDKVEAAQLYNENDLFNVRITEIRDTGNSITYQNTPFYEHKLLIKLDVTSDQLINMNNTNLRIEFNTNEKIEVKVGNISFFKQTNENNINIQKVQGIVNDFGIYQSLSAVKLRISSSNDCKITNIFLVSPSLTINYSKLLFADEIECEHNTPAKDIFGNDFDNFINNKGSFTEINLFKNIEKDVIIPLHYSEKELVDSIGIIIEYLINGVSYRQTINPYRLFNTTDLEYFIDEYRIINN